MLAKWKGCQGLKLSALGVTDYPPLPLRPTGPCSPNGSLLVKVSHDDFGPAALFEARG